MSRHQVLPKSRRITFRWSHQDFFAHFRHTSASQIPTSPPAYILKTERPIPACFRIQASTTRGTFQRRQRTMASANFFRPFELVLFLFGLVCGILLWRCIEPCVNVLWLRILRRRSLQFTTRRAPRRPRLVALVDLERDAGCESEREGGKCKWEYGRQVNGSGGCAGCGGRNCSSTERR